MGTSTETCIPRLERSAFQSTPEPVSQAAAVADSSHAHLLRKMGGKTTVTGALSRKHRRQVPPEMLQAFALQLRAYIPELGTEANLARAIELFLADRVQQDRPQEPGERLSWLRRAEVCRRCGISLRTLDYWLERGLLAKQKVGRIVMVDMRELQRLMQTHTVRNQDGVAA